MSEHEMRDKPDKGQFGGSCNRGACQKPVASFYNQSTRQFYCEECARLLNRVNDADAHRLFGSSLCVPQGHPAHPWTVTQPIAPSRPL